jgi:hypothetical protein
MFFDALFIPKVGNSSKLDYKKQLFSYSEVNYNLRD